MTQQSETFGIVFENIPIINLRNEVVRYYATLDQRGANSRGIGEGVCAASVWNRAEHRTSPGR